MILDTHRFVENLISAGFKKHQAEVFVQELNENQSELATKEDIKEVKSEMKVLKLELQESIKMLERDVTWIKSFLFLVLGAVVSLWFK